MLNKNPHNCITIDQIKSHPWITQTPFSYILDPNFGIDEFWRLSEVPPGEGLIDDQISQKMRNFTWF